MNFSVLFLFIYLFIHLLPLCHRSFLEDDLQSLTAKKRHNQVVTFSKMGKTFLSLSLPCTWLDSKVCSWGMFAPQADHGDKEAAGQSLVANDTANTVFQPYKRTSLQLWQFFYCNKRSKGETFAIYSLTFQLQSRCQYDGAKKPEQIKFLKRNLQQPQDDLDE